MNVRRHHARGVGQVTAVFTTSDPIAVSPGGVPTPISIALNTAAPVPSILPTVTAPSFLTDSSMFAGIPNWAVLALGAGLLYLFGKGAK